MPPQYDATYNDQLVDQYIGRRAHKSVVKLPSVLFTLLFVRWHTNYSYLSILYFRNFQDLKTDIDYNDPAAVHDLPRMHPGQEMWRLLENSRSWTANWSPMCVSIFAFAFDYPTHDIYS